MWSKYNSEISGFEQPEGKLSFSEPLLKLKDMAQKMIDDQKKEIRELSDWLKNNKR